MKVVKQFLQVLVYNLSKKKYANDRRKIRLLTIVIVNQNLQEL